MSAALCAQDSRQFTDVPFVPTATDVVDAMLDLARVKPGDVLIDLGSGDGRIVLAAAKRFGIQATGVEIDPDLVRQSQKQARQEGLDGKAAFVQADLFTYDLRRASVVTIFLTPGVNLRLRPKLLSELQPGTRIVSHRFDMGSWPPTKTVQLGDDRIFLWVVPAPGEAAAADHASPQSPAQANPVAMFAYDATVPLNTHLEKSEAADGALMTAVSYAGARGPVSATLVTPARPGKYPAVIFVPEYGRRDEFLPEALLMARAKQPAAALMIDGPQERPLGWRRTFNSMSDDDNDRDIHIQAVIDIRRGVDMLAQRDDIDAQRIAYVGHGYGANWGAILSSMETRLHAFVLVAGFPSLAELMESDDPEMANMRFSMGPERFARYKASISAVDPIRFTRFWMGAPILFQFGRFDQFVPRAAAERLAQSFACPQEPKEASVRAATKDRNSRGNGGAALATFCAVPKAVFYDAGHSVNAPQAMADRSEFLARTILR